MARYHPKNKRTTPWAHPFEPALKPIRRNSFAADIFVIHCRNWCRATMSFSSANAEFLRKAIVKLEGITDADDKEIRVALQLQQQQQQQHA